MDWGAIGAAATSAVGNVAGTMFGKKKAARLARQNAAYGYQLARENARIAPSYEMEGYKAAGINPFVDNAGAIGDYQAPTVDTPTSEMSGLGTAAVQAFQQQRLTEAQANMLNSQEELNYVNSDVGKENVNYIRAQTRCSLQQAQNLAVEFYKISQETDNLKIMKQKMVSDIALNYANVDLAAANKRLAEMNTRSVQTYIEQKLPVELKKMSSDIDVNKTMADINRIKFQEISQKVTLQEMDIMQASEALASNIKAAGVEAQARLARAYLGLSSAQIDHMIADQPQIFMLRLATRMIGTMSNDLQTDLVGNLSSAFGQVASRVAGAAVAAGM